MQLKTPVVAACIALITIALIVTPLIVSPFYTDFVTRVMIFAILAMSLDLLLGVTGLVSLGHAGFFGLAGYALALMTPDTAPISLWWSLPAALAITAAAALVIGFLAVRTKGIYFIMVTLAFSQMLFYLFHDNKFAGGSDGKYLNFKPTAVLFNLDNKTTLFYFVLVCLVLTFVALRLLLASNFGRVLCGIKVNEHRMRALGYGTFAYKLAAFTLAGTLAGLAGYLAAMQSGYVNPELLGFHLSANTIMMVILGGMGNFAGAVLGAFAFETLLFVFKDLSKHWQLLMGSFIVLLVLFAPHGLLGLLGLLQKREPIK